MTLEHEARRRVLIFRNEVLPASETFILAQARAMTRFAPVFAGVHAAPRSLELPSPPVLLDRAGTWRERFGGECSGGLRLGRGSIES